MKLVEQFAGIRPTVQMDRRPLVGLHPKHPRLAVLNGLGTTWGSDCTHHGCKSIVFVEIEKGVSLDVSEIDR